VPDVVNDALVGTTNADPRRIGRFWHEDYRNWKLPVTWRWRFCRYPASHAAGRHRL